MNFVTAPGSPARGVTKMNLTEEETNPMVWARRKLRLGTGDNVVSKLQGSLQFPSALCTCHSSESTGPGASGHAGTVGSGSAGSGALGRVWSARASAGVGSVVGAPEDRPQLDDGTCLTQGTEYHSVAFKTDAFWVQIDLPFVPLN